MTSKQSISKLKEIDMQCECISMQTSTENRKLSAPKGKSNYFHVKEKYNLDQVKTED